MATKLEIAAYRLTHSIQQQIEEIPGWHQLDSYNVEIDGYHLNQLTKILGHADPAKMHELHGILLSENTAPNDHQKCDVYGDCRCRMCRPDLYMEDIHD